MENTKAFVKNNSTKIISFIFITCVSVVVLIMVFQLYKGFKKQHVYSFNDNWFGSNRRDTPFDMKTWLDGPGKDTNAHSYTLSLNIKVDSFDPVPGIKTGDEDKPKLILYRGKIDENKNLLVNPGIWIYPNTADFIIRVSNYYKDCKRSGGCNFVGPPSTHGDSIMGDCQQQCIDSETCKSFSIKSDGVCDTNGSDYTATWNSDAKKTLNTPFSQCDIKGFPIQSWVNLTLVYNNTTLDVYLNGELKRSCPNIISLPISENFTINPEYDGEIKDLQYFEYAMNPYQVNSLVNTPGSTFMLNLNAPRFKTLF